MTADRSSVSQKFRGEEFRRKIIGRKIECNEAGAQPYGVFSGESKENIHAFGEAWVAMKRDGISADDHVRKRPVTEACRKSAAQSSRKKMAWSLIY